MKQHDRLIIPIWMDEWLFRGRGHFYVSSFPISLNVQSQIAMAAGRKPAGYSKRPSPQLKFSFLQPGSIPTTCCNYFNQLLSTWRTSNSTSSSLYMSKLFTRSNNEPKILEIPYHEHSIPQLRGSPLFSSNHGLRLGGADSLPGCFTLSCKLFWGWRSCSEWRQQNHIICKNVILQFPNWTPSLPGNVSRSCLWATQIEWRGQQGAIWKHVWLCAKDVDRALTLLYKDLMACSNRLRTLYCINTCHRCP